MFMKYLKLYEAYSGIDMKNEVNRSINWKMVDDIKDMSLEYLDDDFRLIIDVYLTDIGKHEMLGYRLTYDHRTDDLEGFKWYNRWDRILL